MVRLAVIGEGKTEVEFVDLILRPHLLAKGVLAISTPLGGNVSVARLADRMVKLSWDFDWVTSLVDFYGFRDKGSATVTDLERLIHHSVITRRNPPKEESRIIPYVQQYEFEGLLFSNPNAFAAVLGVTDNVVNRLTRMRAPLDSPEEINDSENTAPSKRISRIIPEYNKVVHGPLVAMSISLPAIRRECPRFRQWIGRLESLGS